MSVPSGSSRRSSADLAAADGDGGEELAQARALIEHAPDVIVILDVDTGCSTSVNGAAEQPFGRSRAQLLRMGPVEVSPPVQPNGRRSAEAAWLHVEQALAGGRPRFAADPAPRRPDQRRLPVVETGGQVTCLTRDAARCPGCSTAGAVPTR